MRWLGFVIFLLSVSSLAYADAELAKQEFEQGVALAAEKRWEEAASHLEDSLREEERPAARFNLIIAYDKLSRPLEVIRHALSFLALPDDGARSVARAQAAKLMERASTQLAILTTSALPSDAVIRIDGSAPMRDGSRVYVTPGFHRLEARGAGLLESIELQLSAGQRMPWPRQGFAPPAQPEPKAATRLTEIDATTTGSSRLLRVRRGIALGFGISGALLGLATLTSYGLAHRLENKLANAASVSGFTDNFERYLHLQNTLIPLSVSAGLTMATAVAVGPRANRRRHWGWSLASLAAASAVLGVGVSMMVRDAGNIPGTRIPMLRPYAGSVLASASLPLFSFGVVSSYGADKRTAFSISPTGVSF